MKNKDIDIYIYIITTNTILQNISTYCLLQFYYQYYINSTILLVLYMYICTYIYIYIYIYISVNKTVWMMQMMQNIC